MMNMQVLRLDQIKSTHVANNISESGYEIQANQSNFLTFEN